MLQKNDNMKENQRVKIIEMGEHITIDRRVEVIGLDVIGTIAFVGNTQFAAGQWLGLNLDIPRGNNDGSVKGISYFKCDEKHGMFVRTSQIKLLDEMIMDRDDEEKFVEDLILNTNNSTWAEDFPIIPPPKEFADDPPESPVSPTFCFCCSIPNDNLEHTVLINRVPIKTKNDAVDQLTEKDDKNANRYFEIGNKKESSKFVESLSSIDPDPAVKYWLANHHIEGQDKRNEQFDAPVRTKENYDEDEDEARTTSGEDNDQKDSTDQNDDQSCKEENEESDNNDKSCCSSTRNEDGVKPTTWKIFDRGRIVYAKAYDDE